MRMWRRVSQCLIRLLGREDDTRATTSFDGCIREWVNAGYELVKIECRIRQEAWLTARRGLCYESLDVWPDAQLTRFLDELRAIRNIDEVDDFGCLYEAAILEIDGVEVSIAIDIVPALPQGMDLGIHIVNIE